MRILIFAALLWCLPLSAGAADAPKAFDPAARAKRIAPFLDPQTIAVAHVDLTRVRVQPAVEQAAQWFPQVRKELLQAGLGLNMGLTVLTATGASEVYAVVSLDDLNFSEDPLPVLIFPLPEGNDGAPLAALLQNAPFPVVRRMGNVMFVGTTRAWDRVQQTEAEARDELAAAFEAVGDTTAQAFFLPPRHTARVIEEMMPRLPEELGGGPSTTVTHGMRWAAVSLEGPPNLSLRLVVQSDDEASARGFARFLRFGVDLIARQEDVIEAMPDFVKIGELMTPKVQGDRLVLVMDEESESLALLAQNLAAVLRRERDRARRTASRGHMCQIAIALQHYHAVHKKFPAAASYDAEGKALLSWRVHILPHLEEQALYEQFHLDEPWDSPHNRELIGKMPRVYRSPVSQREEAGWTNYVAPVAEETVLGDRQGVSLEQITDGTSNTILLVEADDKRAVVWTRPADLPVDLAAPAEGLGGFYEGRFLATFCDGSVRSLSSKLDAETLRRLFQRADGKTVDY